MPRPFFRIMDGDIDIADRVRDRGISLSVSDGVGRASDTVSFSIDDAEGVIAPPATGKDLRILGGYLDGQMRDFGIFTVDEVVLAGWPQTITVNLQSIRAKGSLKQQRSRSYKTREFATYGALFSAVAARNELTLSMPQEIAQRALQFEAQQEETDTEFVTRIGDRLGLSTTFKDRRLVLVQRGYGLSSSGLTLPSIEISRPGNLLSYSVSRKDRSLYTMVRASYFDRSETETKEVTAPSSNQGPDYLLREPFASEEEALDAARAKAEDLRRGSGSASFVIDGEPFAMAEAYAHVRGVRDLVNGRWRATTVTHEWSASGPYTTTIDSEVPGDEEANADEEQSED